MRRFTILIILVSYLSSISEVHELFKAANLFAHYMQHREQDQGLSFSDFLEMHYNESSAHACAEEHNDRLPFKSHHASVSLLNFVAVIPSVTCVAIPSWVAEVGSPTSYYHPLSVSSGVSAIWQPPKLA
jgi:hypothetical protein